MRIARWIPKGTNTRSKYVLLIAFPLQKLLQECPSMLRTYIARLFANYICLFLMKYNCPLSVGCGTELA